MGTEGTYKQTQTTLALQYDTRSRLYTAAKDVGARFYAIQRQDATRDHAVLCAGRSRYVMRGSGAMRYQCYRGTCLEVVV